MKKTYTIWAIIIVIIIGLAIFIINRNGVSKNNRSVTYIIEGQKVSLQNGRAETAIPNSNAKTVTQYFGNDATGDLNGDGTADYAFLLTQSSGGSGMFYYLAAVLSTADGHIGTNAVLLGDRIAPQSTEIKDGQITVNYAERKTAEPMTATPSVGISQKFKVVGNTLQNI